MAQDSGSFTRRRLLTAGVATLASTAAGRAGADDLRSGVLRDEVAAILRSDFPDVPFTLDPDPRQITFGRATLFLDNLNARVEGLTGSLRRAIIVDFIRPAATARPAKAGPAETFLQASGRLRIQLVPNVYREQAPELVARRFSDRLLVTYVLDEANRYQLVTRPIFDRWGVDQATVERIAIDNLAKASEGVEVHISATGARGKFATHADASSYAGARLLVPMVMDQIREGLGTSSIVVGVPTRDVLIAWTPDSAMKTQLARTVTDYMERGPYSRSRELFASSSAGLRPLTPFELSQHGRAGGDVSPSPIVFDQPPGRGFSAPKPSTHLRGA